MEAHEICQLSAVEIAASYRSRSLSPVEVVEAVLERILDLNPVLTAFYTVAAESARAEAAAAERAAARGQLRSSLHGVPLGIKDLVLTEGVRTTLGSRVHEHHVPEENAPVAQAIADAGGILLGKTATSELGWKSPTATPLFGATRNPWHLDRTSAGSSGGSAVAVATGMGPIAIGSDGGGSIRQPASFCGVFGFKPSFGLVPSYPPGVIDTFGSIGPLSRTVRDAALLMDVIARPDDRDWFSAPLRPPSFLSGCEGGIEGLRVAWSSDLGYAAVEPEVRQLAEVAAMRFTELGCIVEEVAPGWADPSDLFHVLFWGLMGAQVEDLLPDWKEQLDPGLVGLTDLGRRYTAFDVARAMQARAGLQQQALRFFRTYDLLLTPTMTMTAFELGIDVPDRVAGQPVHGMQWTAFTFPFNLTGQPAASVPAGWSAEGLPVGLQIVGRRWADDVVLRAAVAYETVAPWAQRWPSLNSIRAQTVNPPSSTRSGSSRVLVE